jgi:hypothetical protein
VVRHFRDLAAGVRLGLSPSDLDGRKVVFALAGVALSFLFFYFADVYLQLGALPRIIFFIRH